MKDQAFATLEYDALLALILRYAQTPLGRSRIETLRPIENVGELPRALTAVSECIALRQRGIVLSFLEIVDPVAILGRLRVADAALDSLAILQLARLCEVALSARSVILAERENCPTLWAIVEDLPRELNSVVARITNKILPSGELDDRASPELARIRHEIVALRSHITRSLESLMRRSDDAIQDELVTLRNDRFVIPVKADHRSRVQGVAHGVSSSGATVFIEPLATIDSNNELQALKETEEREVARILFELTEQLRKELPGLELVVTAVEELDFVNAKSSFAQKFDCVIPEIDFAAGSQEEHSRQTGSLELVDARHPLLEENLRKSETSVVPISLTLDDTHSAMVISGANAGGKTVVLKTTGLLALMALSGLPVPAKSARVPFYAGVLADIGDHQSLAANLSTFTSHVANISKMISLCRSPALVLLDEVGTGTDPEEGSALGVAVVDHFRRVCGAHVLATTHYSGLKMYAANEAGVLNASVEFDDETLQPTYRLLIGIAGSSSGLEIAKRFGVPEEIVASAAKLVDHSSLDATEYLRRIKHEADEARALRLALEEERSAVAEKYASLETEASKRDRRRQLEFEKTIENTVRELDKRSREMVAAIQDRAERLKVERESQRRVAELKREAQRLARGVQPPQAFEAVAPGTPKRDVRVIRDGKVLQASQADVLPGEEESYVVSNARPIVVGDTVRLRTFGSTGIVDQIKDDEAEVRVKSLRFREKLENLELLEASAAPKKVTGRFSRLRPTRQTEVHLKATDEKPREELNVIGHTTDEAIDAVDKFLDESSLASLSHVRIVHGHGTGALRRAIGDLLKGHPHVMRFTTAPPDQGGGGATIVELRS